MGSRSDVVVKPWKNMSCVWSLETSDGPKLMTVASRRGRTLLFEGRVDLSNAANEGEEHGDAVVATMSHKVGSLFSDGSTIGFHLRVDLDKFRKWSAAEKSLLLAIAVDPWWSEHPNEPHNPYATSGGDGL